MPRGRQPSDEKWRLHPLFGKTDALSREGTPFFMALPASIAETPSIERTQFEIADAALTPCKFIQSD